MNYIQRGARNPNPWVELAEQLTGGVTKGISRAREFQNKLGLEKYKQEHKGLSAAENKQLGAANQGLKTIQRQKERLASGHLGPKINFNPWASGGESKLFSAMGGEGKKTRAAYEQAGKELIQLASTLPIRNKREFDVLGHKLYDPTLQQEEIAGILQEMEDHIRDSLDSISKKPWYNPKNKEHVDKAWQLHEKFKDKEKVREALRREFGGL